MLDELIRFGTQIDTKLTVKEIYPYHTVRKPNIGTYLSILLSKTLEVTFITRRKH